ncbi:hypothetical protein [Corynebacterium riegelii]|uniref:hypothetical protein n=1 Tax=Corynebacterium riegelii TaxID=156976 RepID=UPI00288B804F|nr:hypothetical protein [Corynebacterium riegelii]
MVHTHGSLIGAWDFAAVGRLAPKPGRFSVLLPIHATFSLTDRRHLSEAVAAGQGAVVTSGDEVLVDVEPSAYGVQLDAVVGAAAESTVEIYQPEPFTLRSVTTKPVGQARVFVGSMFGQTSPVVPPSPLVAAEIRLAPGAEVAMTLEPDFEYGLLAASDEIALQNTPVPRGVVGYTDVGTATWGVKNLGNEEARAVIFGGKVL